MVNPISFGPSGINSQADFSPLAQLGQIYQKAQQDQANKAALAAFQQTGDPRALLGSGDMNLAQLGMNAQRHADVLRQQGVENVRADANLKINQGRANREAADYENTPDQFVKNPDGTYTDQYATIKATTERAQRKIDAEAAGLTPGTPAYQQFMATGSLTALKGKDLPSGVVKDMAEKGGTLEDFSRLNTGFKDEYGGFGSEWVGESANAVARSTGLGNTERASWWQDYQNQKNVVRNKLFGSALTATEKAEFDKANITPGMTPKIIKENLARQHDSARRAAAKLANTYTKMGYSQEQIEAAIGLPLAELAAPATGTAAAPTPTAAGAAPKPVPFTSYFSGQ